MPLIDLGVGGTASPNKYATLAAQSAGTKSASGTKGYVGIQPTQLTFGGAAQPTTPYNGMSFPNTPTGGSVFGATGAPAGFNWGSVVGGILGGTSTPAASGPAGGPAPTSTVTAQVDGSTGFISGLQDQLAGILGGMGSTGDAPAQAYPVSYANNEQGGVLDLPVILAVLAVAGVFYAVYKS